MKIRKDKVVSIEYKMVDKEGKLISTSDDGDALSFIQGRATVFPAIEEQVEGHEMGSRLTFTLEPRQAYGERDENLVKVIPRGQFNLNGDIEVGMKFVTRKNDRELPVLVTAVSGDEITVDANHPLVGTALNIDLVIVDVREAIEAELESGVVQEMNDIYTQEQTRNQDKDSDREIIRE
jgi:FKBP-type peptidyl-prolyl cis-trans isomerase SlyD